MTVKLNRESREINGNQLSAEVWEKIKQDMENLRKKWPFSSSTPNYKKLN